MPEGKSGEEELSDAKALAAYEPDVAVDGAHEALCLIGMVTSSSRSTPLEGYEATMILVVEAMGSRLSGFLPAR